MRILVLNAGSSSLKYKLFESEGVSFTTDTETALAQGEIERVGTGNARFIREDGRGRDSFLVEASDINDALDLVLSAIVEPGAPLSSLEEIEAVGHRVAHGGEVFNCSVAIDDHVVETIERYSYLAPLHNPSALEVIGRCRKLLPDALQVAAFDTAFHQTMPARNYVYPIPYRYYEELNIRRYGFHGISHKYVSRQVAAFDTAFHQTMPARNYVYPIPYRYYEELNIRRYGFHGISHKYVSRRAARFLGKSSRDLKMVTCHLGSGASLAAIDHGISMDTTMGYTPLDGIMMGTRSGSVDPAIITAIMERENLTPAQMDAILNRESGLLGVSGVSGDLRKLKEVIKYGNEQAELAYDIFLTSIRRMIGAYFFELAGVDVIVCTAGVGENDPYARRLIFRGLEPFGIRIDEERNMEVGRADRVISTDDSKVKVLVIPTDEEAEIARDVQLIAAGVDISDPYSD